MYFRKKLITSVEALLCPEDQLFFGSGIEALNDEDPSDVMGMGMQEENQDEQEEEVVCSPCR